MSDVVDPRALLEGTTPGPWASFSYGSSEMDGLGLGVCVKGKSLEAAMGDDSVFICDFQPTMMANSHLAAAAPQLAQACIAKDERIVVLEGALRPFALEADNYDYGDGSGPDLKDAPNESSLREINDLLVGDLRHARVALTNTGALA